jgi:O-antigen/teichoic acid export membrane protein
MLGMRTASDIRMRTGMHVDWAGARLLFSEGWKFQVATAISMVRDNLHYLLVAPVFGVGWAGYYSWALQLATVSSQVFVQTASRVALPFLRGEGHAGEKWDTALVQVKWLAIFTLPLVAFIYHIADATNRLLFADKWTVALPLVLAFSARMVPGIVTTALSYFVLAQRGSASFAKCNFWWTCAEVGAGVILLAAVGPTGLAWSYSVMAWVGVLLFLREARQGGMRIVLATLLCRKSLIAGMVASIAVYYLGRDVHGMVELVLCAVLIVVAILAEPQVRTLGRSWWVSRR